jgi:hypothetical protein
MEPHPPQNPPPPTADEPGWPERPKNIRRLIALTVVLCAVVVTADLFYSKHGHYGFEDITGFHALYGLLSYVGLVLISGQLRKFLKREEDYYD